MVRFDVRFARDSRWGAWASYQASEEPFGSSYVVQAHDGVPAKHFHCAVVRLSGHG